MRSTGPARASPIRARACSRRARHFLVRCAFPCRPIPKMPAAFECVLDIKASLGECPVWSVDEQVLYWVDINAPSLNRFDPRTGRNAAWAMPSSIGCFALRRSGGFIAALRDGFWLLDRDGKPERKVADAPYDSAHHRFNDGRADAHGRFWAGSMNEKRDANSARLYRLDPDFTLAAMISDIMISNGLAWSPDGRTLYHTDTPTRTIYAWGFDAATGALANRRVFAQFAGETDARDVSDDVRVRRSGLDDAVRDHRAPASRPRGACADAPIGRDFRAAHRRAGPA